MGWLPGSASYYLLALGASLAFCYYLLALGAKKRVHLAVSQLMECGIDLLVLEYPDIPQHRMADARVCVPVPDGSWDLRKFKGKLLLNFSIILEY